MSGEKTEDPSATKLREARKKGEVAKSTDVAVAASLLGVLATVTMTGADSMARLRHVVLMATDLGPASQAAALPMEHLYKIIARMATELLWIIGPPALVSGLLAAVAMAAQVGLKPSFEPVTPKPAKVDPAAGVKRIFSARSLITFLQMLLKACLLWSVLWSVATGLVPMLSGSAYQTVDGVGRIAWKAVLTIVAAGALLYLVIAPADYVLQRWLFRRDQKMSKDDQKQEYKQEEGDPTVKAMRRQLAQEMALSDPREEVANAHAVVVNPTHYAVAIRFVSGSDALPVVVAKGVDEAALAMRRHAEQIGVPVFANPPLARALHKVPLRGTVPEELFEAVAAILRWVGEVGRRKQAP